MFEMSILDWFDQDKLDAAQFKREEKKDKMLRPFAN